MSHHIINIIYLYHMHIKAYLPYTENIAKGKQMQN
jgi:hypothetical protein